MPRPPCQHQEWWCACCCSDYGAFTVFGVDGGEMMSAVQIAMIAGLPYTALRDAILAHPTLAEGLMVLFSSTPASVVHDLEEKM